MSMYPATESKMTGVIFGSDPVTIRQRGFEVVPDEHRQYPDESIRLPQRATCGSACYDVYSPVSVYIAPHASTIICTDVRAYMQPGEVLMAYPRSSMGKIPIRLCNGTGVIDSDYYGNETNGGNIAIMLQNMSDHIVEIKQGERICQMMFTTYLLTDNDETDRIRAGGFGSTGS